MLLFFAAFKCYRGGLLTFDFGSRVWLMLIRNSLLLCAFGVTVSLNSEGMNTFFSRLWFDREDDLCLFLSTLLPIYDNAVLLYSLFITEIMLRIWLLGKLCFFDLVEGDLLALFLSSGVLMAV